MHQLAKLIVTLVLSALTGQAYSQVGNVILAYGDAYALDQTSEMRLLHHRSAISAGDTLITGPNSEMHIRFHDNAIFALRTNSRLTVNQYYAKTSTQPEKILLELHSGGFRTISNSFGNISTYQINTPSATVGVNASSYELVLNSDTLYAAAYQGSIQIINNNDSMHLGPDNDFSYASVLASNSKITGQVQPPAVLTQTLAAPANIIVDDDQPALAKNASVITQEDNDGFSISNFVTSTESTIKNTVTLNEAFKPKIEPVGHLSAHTEQIITELMRQTNLKDDIDVRFTLSQLHNLDGTSDTGFMNLNTLAEYSPAVYEFSHPLSSGTLAAAVSFDILLKSGSSEETITVTLPAGRFSHADLNDAVNSAVSDSTLSNRGNTAIIPSMVLVYRENNTMTLVGYSAGVATSEFEVTNFVGSSTDTETLKSGLGLCSSSSCLNTSFALGQQSTGNNIYATHFSHLLNSDAFAHYDTKANTTNLDNVHTEIAQLESSAETKDYADLDWGDWNNSSAINSEATLIAQLEANFSTDQSIGSIALADDELNIWNSEHFGTSTGERRASEFTYGTLTYNMGSSQSADQADSLFIDDSSQFGFLGNLASNATKIAKSTQNVFYITE